MREYIEETHPRGLPGAAAKLRYLTDHQQERFEDFMGQRLFGHVDQIEISAEDEDAHVERNLLQGLLEIAESRRGAGRLTRS